MEIVEELSHHPLVVTAARVGRTFRQDPVMILRDGGDELLNLVRTAATLVVQRDDEKEAEKARAQSRRGRRR
jgi:hypothetical protein